MRPHHRWSEFLETNPESARLLRWSTVSASLSTERKKLKKIPQKKKMCDSLQEVRASSVGQRLLTSTPLRKKKKANHFLLHIFCNVGNAVLFSGLSWHRANSALSSHSLE
jgi:hypothetical protein